ncbi:MAG: hypothetical protein ACK41E_00160 [Deinococcales bacterium]
MPTRLGNVTHPFRRVKYSRRLEQNQRQEQGLNHVYFTGYFGFYLSSNAEQIDTALHQGNQALESGLKTTAKS